MKKLFPLMLLLLSATWMNAQVARTKPDLAPTGKGVGVEKTDAPARDLRTGFGNGISYHGGPVMLGTIPIYFIWYGTWNGSGANGTNRVSDSATTENLLSNEVSGLSGSSYEHINTTYYNGSNQHVSGLLSMAGSTTDNYSRGSSLSDSDIQTIVAAHAGHDLPLNNNAIYFVLTSSDVNETSGFCTQYCGWHTHGTISGQDIKYSFVGNPDRCPSACEAQSTSPNNDSGGDGMASIVAHESEEAISDPDLNAWYDRRGNENADKCAWTFGTTSTASNGSAYNIVLNGTEYLIQRNWVNASGGYCSMSF